MQVSSISPSVSIVLPTFNRARYLNTCFQSVVKQSFKQWQIIIIDDGSTDASNEIVAKWVQGDCRVRAVLQNNVGLPFALNIGVLLCEAQYITFINSDDQYAPDHLALRFEHMQKNPHVDFIHGGASIVGDPYVVDKYDATKKIHLQDCPIGGTFFGKRNVFLELNGFNNLAYSEDSDFFERVQKKFVVGRVDFPTYRYDRTTPDSITNQKNSCG